MTRAPFQVLVFPYRLTSNGGIEYALFKRRDSLYWQAIAGGGEDHETPLQAAKREAYEEGGVSPESPFMALQSVASIPVEHVAGFLWGDDVLVIPEYSFGVQVQDPSLVLSPEHTEVRWVDYETAMSLLHWDSNRVALWELNLRLQRAAAQVDEVC